MIVGVHNAAVSKTFIVPTADSPCPGGRNYSPGSVHEYEDGDIDEFQYKSMWHCPTLEQHARLFNDLSALLRGSIVIII